ncbi:MAG: hypothetical protein NWF13_00825 [Candidatus Bathyarchaeota archaeon]|nr:hypothetical protein [Candidatus Bathyarchaeota archaeon]
MPCKSARAPEMPGASEEQRVQVVDLLNTVMRRVDAGFISSQPMTLSAASSHADRIPTHSKLASFSYKTHRKSVK